MKIKKKVSKVLERKYSKKAIINADFKQIAYSLTLRGFLKHSSFTPPDLKRFWANWNFISLLDTPKTSALEKILQSRLELSSLEGLLNTADRYFELIKIGNFKEAEELLSNVKSKQLGLFGFSICNLKQGVSS